MKKFVLTIGAAVIAGLFFSANAGNGNIDKETRKQMRRERREERNERWMHTVTRITEDQFYYDFPNAKDVSWTRNEFMEARFTDGTIKKTAYYDNDDELVGTTTEIDYQVLPDRAKETISKKYPGFEPQSTLLFDDNEVNDTDMILFASSFEDEDMYFTILSNGIKEIILKVNMNGEVSFFQEYKAK